MASRRFTVDLAKKKEFINIFLLMPESSVLNARHLCHCCDGIVAFVVMASLPLPMCRHLAVVDDDGNGAKGGDDDDGATGDNDDDDGDGATEYDVIDNCDGATGGRHGLDA